jgi:hypothetical protein
MDNKLVEAPRPQVAGPQSPEEKTQNQKRPVLKLYPLSGKRRAKRYLPTKLFSSFSTSYFIITPKKRIFYLSPRT